MMIVRVSRVFANPTYRNDGNDFQCLGTFQSLVSDFKQVIGSVGLGDQFIDSFGGQRRLPEGLRDSSGFIGGQGSESSGYHGIWNEGINEKGWRGYMGTNYS